MAMFSEDAIRPTTAVEVHVHPQSRGQGREVWTTRLGSLPSMAPLEAVGQMGGDGKGHPAHPNLPREPQRVSAPTPTPSWSLPERNGKMPGRDSLLCAKRCEDPAVGSEQGLERPDRTRDVWPTPSGWEVAGEGRLGAEPSLHLSLLCMAGKQALETEGSGGPRHRAPGPCVLGVMLHPTESSSV